MLFLWASYAVAEESRTPSAEIDTIGPVYDWAEFPYSWNEIQDGEFSFTPVRWRRNEKNPVVPRGMNSRPYRWSDSTVRVYYGIRGPGNGIHYFDVDPTEPDRIVAGPAGPIISTGKPGDYDDDWVICPEPVRLSKNHLRMYYSAKRSGREFFDRAWSLAVADSHDNGATWTKYAGNPILETGEQPWESGAVGFCSVEQADDGWRMWYLGTTKHAIKQIGYATSSDGLDWRRHPNNPVIAVDPDNRWEAGAVAVPRVIRDGRLYKVWYCSYEQNNTYAIGFAESFDGVRWYRGPHNPVMLGSGEGWDAHMAAYPGVIKTGGRYLMWYSGNGYGSRGVGLATADPPKGEWVYRASLDAEKPDWSVWKRVADAEEPERSGQIQFAVLSRVEQ